MKLILLWLISSACSSENANSLVPEINEIDINSNDDQIYHMVNCESYCIGCCVDNKCLNQAECELYFLSSAFMPIAIILTIAIILLVLLLSSVVRRLFWLCKWKPKHNYTQKLNQSSFIADDMVVEIN
jgi:hypothetical protein